jgi:hypothetical protein
MTRNNLKKLAQELAEMRRSPQKAIALEGLAKKLGRRSVKRGKEPTWENDNFPELRPLAIPHHGARDLPPGTKNSILTQLEDDLIAWENKLEQQR